MKRSLVLTLTVVFALTVLFFGGCSKKDAKKTHKTLKGTVTSIDAANKIVTMDWFNEKVGRTVTIAGKVVPETEIYIDGKLADIGQVRENDHVVVEGYRKGSDIVALNVKITRSNDTSIKIKRPGATTQPAGRTKG